MIQSSPCMDVHGFKEIPGVIIIKPKPVVIGPVLTISLYPFHAHIWRSLYVSVSLLCLHMEIFISDCTYPDVISEVP